MANANPAAQRRTARTGSDQPNLRADLRDFAAARPSGWSHEDWVNFLDHLSSRGHDTSDADQIGAQLEAERLLLRLERVQGVGPRRAQNIVERFGSIWRLREASVDEVAAAAGLPRPLAEKVCAAAREE